MFTNWFGSKSAKKKPVDDIPEKIELYNRKWMHENMGMIDKKARLQLLVQEKGKAVLKQPMGLRLISALKRHSAMMRVYQTSLTALERSVLLTSVAVIILPFKFSCLREILLTSLFQHSTKPRDAASDG